MNNGLKSQYEAVVKKVTKSKDSWKKFLTFSSGIFKYSFDTALLVYAQNPKATMIATYDIWKRVGRQVERGEKSITVQSFNDGGNKTVHLFDISQTSGSNVPKIWTLDAEIEPNLLEVLNNRNNLKCNNLGDCLFKLTEKRVSENIEYYSNKLQPVLKGIPYFDISDDAFRAEIKGIVCDSAGYTALSRCGMAGDYFNNENCFKSICKFGSVSALSLLGNYINTVSKDVLMQTEKNIKAILKERGSNYGRKTDTQPSLYRERRNQVVTASDRQGTAETLGTAGDEVYKGNRPGPLHTDGDDRHPDADASQSRQGSLGENGADTAANVQKISGAEFGGLSFESAAHELDSGHGGGNSPQGNSNDSPLDESNKVLPKEPPKGGSFFAPESKTTPAERREAIEKVLFEHGTGVEDGKQRIYNYFSENDSKTDRAQFLKKEFGVGGAYTQDYNIFHDSTGIKIKNKRESAYEKISWNQAAEIIGGMIAKGKYLENQPKPKIEQITFESLINNPEPQTPLAKEENNLNFKVGDTVYLENTAFEVTQIRPSSVQLRDPALSYPVFRAESLENFERLLSKDNRNNNYILQSEENQAEKTATPQFEPLSDTQNYHFDGKAVRYGTDRDFTGFVPCLAFILSLEFLKQYFVILDDKR